ncbi:hypothetical protein ACOME3_008305 [Neoechinorhynchus agilis]
MQDLQFLGQSAMLTFTRKSRKDMERTDADNTKWNKITTYLMSDVYPLYTCAEYKNNLNILLSSGCYGTETIPKLSALSNFLREKSGFSLRPVSGYICARDFFYNIAFRTFPCTEKIRQHDNLDYSDELDCCHELLGHVPMLVDPEFADLTNRVGLVSIGIDDALIEELAKVYFFTIEFGLVLEHDEIKAVGAGYMGSSKELKHAVTCPEKQKPLKIEDVLKAEIVTDNFQNQYFVADSYEHLLKFLSDFCDTIPRKMNASFVEKALFIKPEEESKLPKEAFDQIETEIAQAFELRTATSTV